MIWGSISGFLLMLGFAYIVWALAAKDDTNTKLCGQIIAALIVLVAVITIIMGMTGYGYRGKMMKGGWEQQKSMQQAK